MAAQHVRTSDRPHTGAGGAAGAPRRGPERFQGHDDDGARRSPLAVLGALLGLVALVAGVPALLLALGGPPPVPRSLPSREQLTGSLGVEQLVTVLVAVVWLAWLQFLVCVVVEVASALRGGGLPRPVPLAGPSQRMARVLVGTLLLTGVVAGQASAAVPLVAGPAPGRDAVVATAIADGAGDRLVGTPSAGGLGQQVGERPAAGPATADEAGADEAGAVAAPLPAELADLVGSRVYTVQAPEGRYHDNLWDIAERHLGDGRRYTEIYELNDDRVQPDGRVLELARLIQPGWQLVMPEDAVAVDRVVAPVAPAPAPAPQPLDEGAGALAGAGPQQAGAELPDGPDGPGGPDGGAGLAAGGDTGATASDLALGGLAAAGAVAALVRLRRRRLGDDPGAAAAEAEVALRVGADPARSELLDGALRSLGAACRDAGRAAPQVYAAVVDEDSVELRLAPAEPAAVLPWTAADDGRRWTLTRGDLGRVAAGSPSPCPALVGLGRDVTGRDVLVDLAAAGGPVAVTGPAAAQVVTALAVELATNPWSDSTDLAVWDLPEELTALAPDAVRVQGAAELVGLLGAGARADVLTGRSAGAVGGRRLLLGSVPGPDVVEQLVAATGAGGSQDGVLVAGDVPGARWTLRTDDAGSLEVAVLGLSVTANRLDHEGLVRLAELFGAARREPAPAPDGSGRPPLPPATAGALAARGTGTADDSHWAAARVRVCVLGPLEVQAPGAVDPSRLELVHELVAHVALHPEGVHPTVLAGAVWPGGVGVGVRDAAVARARDVLGSDASGSYRLGQDGDGRLVLGAGAVVDRDVLLELLRRSRSAASAELERDVLRRALALVRGELLTPRPARRYAWLAREGVERTTAALVVDAALRLAELETGGGDPTGASAAAAAGLRGAPTSQPLWRTLLSATATGGGDVPAAAARMREVLADAGVQVEGETEALLEELAPRAASAG